MDIQTLTLRPSVTADLDILFQFQQDTESAWLAAFMPPDPSNREAFMEKYTRLLNDPQVNNQSVWVEGILVGSIASFIIEGDREITYWIGRDYWGRGIGGRALEQFLKIENTRPLFARVAFDNFGSQSILEKNGFNQVGADKGFANARQQEIEEFIYRL